MSGGSRGCLLCILCQKRLRLSLKVDECKPLKFGVIFNVFAIFLYDYDSVFGQGFFHGRAVQAAPIKPSLKAPGTKRLKLKHNKPLSIILLEFCFHLNPKP